MQQKKIIKNPLFENKLKSHSKNMITSWWWNTKVWAEEYFYASSFKANWEFLRVSWTILDCKSLSLLRSRGEWDLLIERCHDKDVWDNRRTICFGPSSRAFFELLVQGNGLRDRALKGLLKEFNNPLVSFSQARKSKVLSWKFFRSKSVWESVPKA